MRAPRRALAVLLVLPLLACSGGDDDAGAADATSASGTEAEARSGFDASKEIVAAGDADEGIEGVVAFRIGSADHVGGAVDYPVSPPPGGPHQEIWVNCGFHEEPFDDENLVHDLEHGAVWLAYRPDLSDDDLDVLRTLAKGHKVVAAPYEDLEAGEAVVATAWARQLRLESVDDERLEAFVEQYEDASTAPEAGVTCTGTPLG